MLKNFFAIFSLFVLISFSTYSQNSKIMVGGDVGFGIPVGDFSNGHKIGFGLNGVFTYAMKKKFIYYWYSRLLGFWYERKFIASRWLLLNCSD